MKQFEICKKHFGKFKVTETIHAVNAVKAIQKFKTGALGMKSKPGKYYLLRNGTLLTDFRIEKAS